MLVRAVKYKRELAQTFFRFEDKSLVLRCLSEVDWRCIEKLIDVLGPLKEDTLMVSKSKDAMGILGTFLGYSMLAQRC
jgi:hypothetical protein